MPASWLIRAPVSPNEGSGDDGQHHEQERAPAEHQGDREASEGADQERRSRAADHRHGNSANRRRRFAHQRPLSSTWPQAATCSAFSWSSARPNSITPATRSSASA